MLAPDWVVLIVTLGALTLLRSAHSIVHRGLGGGDRRRGIPMKGVIFNELQKMVTEKYGPDAWDTILDETTLQTPSGAFLGPQTYPDQDLLALVATASRMTGIAVPELVRAFGRYLFADLAKLYPAFVPRGSTAKSFLTTVDRVIHVEVRKLHPGAVLPSFEYEDPGEGRLVMTYRSARKLCPLAQGLIEGVGDYYEERIDQAHPACMLRGDPACRFELTFAPLGAGA